MTTVTQKNKDDILEVIDKDADGTGMLCRRVPSAYREPKYEYCILGGLALECGVTPEQMLGYAYPSFVRIDNTSLQEMLESKFGLNYNAQMNLMAENDKLHTDWGTGVHEARRARLRKLVNSWDTAEIAQTG